MEMFCFDGSTGCEKCGAATSCSSAEPDKPHPNCKCNISRVLEECTKTDSYYEEVPGPKYEEANGPGPVPGSIRINILQEIWCIQVDTWECIDFTTAGRSTKQVVTDWVITRLVGDYIQYLV